MAILKNPFDFSAPYNVSFEFDDNLREVPNDRSGMERAVAWLNKQIMNDTLDSRARARLLNMHGVYSRILGHTDAAIESLKTAIDLSESVKDARFLMHCKLRLAHVHQWAGDFDKSNAEFDELILECKSRPELKDHLDLAYQLAAKNAFDQRKYETALQLFNDALKLREKKGDAELLEVTRHCIRVTEARMTGINTAHEGVENKTVGSANNTNQHL
jgi:tetratricopeptide (TPR) repeat protein